MRPALAILLLVTILAMAGCQPQEAYSGRWILSGSHALESGQALEGHLLVTGGQARLAEGSLVTGSVYILAGQVELAGTVRGDVSSLGGRAILMPTALIQGDLVASPGTLERSPGAAVLGTTDQGMDASPTASDGGRVPNLLTGTFQVLAIMLLAYLMARFLPQPVALTAEAVTGHPVACGALGLLFLIVMPALLVQMAFTVILIPVTLVGLLFLVLTAGFGLIALGLVLGGLLGRLIRRSLSPGMAASLGSGFVAIVLVFVGNIPAVGLVLVVLVTAVTSGAALLTRFGTRRFVPAIDSVEARNAG